jgi:hypothetical protein
MYIDHFDIKQFWKKKWLIDVILLIALCVAIYFTVRTSDKDKGFDYNSFLLNLSTEIIGVWLSVRIIDRLLKKRERLENARRNLVQNLRHPFNYAYLLSPRYKRKDVDYLKNEMKWFERRWIKRRSFLKNREADIAMDITRNNYLLITAIENLVIYYETFENWSELNLGDKENDYKWRIEAVDKALIELETSIEKLLLTFWEKDSPDVI